MGEQVHILIQALPGIMMTLRVGEFVGVPCTVQQGPFPDERLVSVDTEDGPISGFVKEANLRLDPADHDRGTMKGVVVKIEDTSITVQLFGSFFTTAQGVASVPLNQLRPLAA